MNLKWFLVIFLSAHSVFASSASDKKPCGLSGTVKERIFNCGNFTHRSDLGAIATLVTRTKSGKEIWLDDTGLLWGDRRDKPMTQKDAEQACGANVTEAEGNITGEKWRLPTRDEFMHIGVQKDGGNKVFRILHNMDRLNWSSSTDRSKAYYFDAGSGYVDYDNQNALHFVSCVAGREPTPQSIPSNIQSPTAERINGIVLPILILFLLGAIFSFPPLSNVPVPATIMVLMGILVVMATCRLFRKAGKPQWAALVPGYNVFMYFRIAGLPEWYLRQRRLFEWYITSCGFYALKAGYVGYSQSGLPYLFLVVNLAIFYFVSLKIAKKFQKGPVFAAGLTLLYPIFIAILGFGPAKYHLSEEPADLEYEVEWRRELRINGRIMMVGALIVGLMPIFFSFISQMPMNTIVTVSTSVVAFALFVSGIFTVLRGGKCPHCQIQTLTNGWNLWGLFEPEVCRKCSGKLNHAT